MSEILIGSDPEFFLKNNKGELTSSIEVGLPGSKTMPHAMNDNIQVQRDNVMAEYNIPPCSNEEDFSGFIKEGVELICNLTDTTPHIVASEEFPDNLLNNKEAKRFGCERDFNVYDQKVNNEVKIPGNLRVAGGHIHIGWDWKDEEELDNVVIAMDLFLGLPSLKLDNDTRRRDYYGQAGNFREKPYGIEYRSLSNFWIATDELRKWAYNQTIKAVSFVLEGNRVEDEDKELIRNAINNFDLEAAERIIIKYNVNTKINSKLKV